MKKKKRLNPVGVDAVVMHAMGIYHPDGHVELMGFGKDKPRFVWHVKGEKGNCSMEHYRKAYRPDCTMKRVRVVVLDA